MRVLTSLLLLLLLLGSYTRYTVNCTWIRPYYCYKYPWISNYNQYSNFVLIEYHII